MNSLQHRVIICLVMAILITHASYGQRKAKELCALTAGMKAFETEHGESFSSMPDTIPRELSVALQALVDQAKHIRYRAFFRARRFHVCLQRLPAIDELGYAVEAMHTDSGTPQFVTEEADTDGKAVQLIIEQGRLLVDLHRATGQRSVREKYDAFNRARIDLEAVLPKRFRKDPTRCR